MTAFVSSNEAVLREFAGLSDACVCPSFHESPCLVCPQGKESTLAIRRVDCSLCIGDEW